MRRVQRYIERQWKESNVEQVVMTTVETSEQQRFYIWQSVGIEGGEKQYNERGFSVGEIASIFSSAEAFIKQVRSGYTPDAPVECSPYGRVLFSSDTVRFFEECPDDGMFHSSIEAAIDPPYTCSSGITVDCYTRNEAFGDSSHDKFVFSYTLLARIFDFARRDDAVREPEPDDAPNMAVALVPGIRKNEIDAIGERMRSGRSFQLQGHDYLISIEPGAEGYDHERGGPSLVRKWGCTLDLVEYDMD